MNITGEGIEFQLQKGGGVLVLWFMVCAVSNTTACKISKGWEKGQLGNDKHVLLMIMCRI